MRHVERGAALREVLFYLFGSLAVSFRGGRDAKRPQQVRRGRTRVTGLTEDRMQSLARQVIKHEVDDAPGVEGLFAGAGGARGAGGAGGSGGSGGGFAAGVHAPDKTSAGADSRP